MFALGSGVKTSQSLFYAIFKALIIAGFKMKIIEFLMTSPVPAVKRIRTQETQCRAYKLPLFDG